MDQGPILMTSFNLDYFPKDPISKYPDVGVRDSMYEFGQPPWGGGGIGGHNSVCNITTANTIKIEICFTFQSGFSFP